jgi:cytochrome c5
MTRIRNAGCTAALSLVFGALIASAQSTPANAPAQKNAPAKAAPAQPAANAKAAPARPALSTKEDPGERAFQANCNRCHYAPEQLTPRISGTILMHMRVRASLSAQDERDIMHFLVP